MLKKYLSLALVVVLFQLFNTGPITATPIAKKKELTPEQVRKSIEKLGTGEKARAIVKLRDGTVHKGFVYDAGDSSFTLLEEKTAQKVTVAYADVVGLKGKNMSTGAKVALGVGLAAAGLAIIGSVLVLAFIASWH
jgi:hypothetical protein